MKNILFLFLSGFIIVSCKSGPKKAEVTPAETRQGTFETKVSMRDFKKNKTYYFDINFVAEKKKALRAEVSAGFGTPVASLGLLGNNMTLLIHTEKKAHTGKINKRSLTPMVGFELDPNIFYSVLFDERVDDSDVELKTTSKKGERKRVMVSRAGHFEMEFYFKSISPKVQDKPDLYTPKIPESYTRHNLQ